MRESRRADRSMTRTASSEKTDNARVKCRQRRQPPAFLALDGSDVLQLEDCRPWSARMRPAEFGVVNQ